MINMNAEEPSRSDQHDDALSRALSGLVVAGELTDAQAREVRAAYDREDALSRARTPLVDPSSAAPPDAASRLPEVLGYLGGTFVAAAALLVLGWSWDEFTYSTKVLVASISAVVAFGGGLVVALVPAGGMATLQQSEQEVRRRLVGVLLTLGSYIATGAVGLVSDHVDEESVLPAVAATALVLTGVAVRLAPGVVPTLGLFVATCMAAATPGDLVNDMDTLVWVLIFMGLGVLWAAFGPRLTRTKTTALALGLGTLVVTGWVAAAHTVYEAEANPFDDPAFAVPLEWGERAIALLGLAVLATLAVVGVALYLRGRPWPWLAAATVAAAGLVFEVAGDAFGPAIAALVAGSLLLVASALLIVRRGRSGPS